MFTGLIDDIGVLEAVSASAAGREFRVRCRYDDLAAGESIALDGACMTVRDCGARWFTAAAVETTLDRTTMGQWEPGRRVNLERAMRVGDRFGGHIVQGHVDGVGTFLTLAKNPDADDYWLTIEIPQDLMPYVVLKGSICIEGVSLTVAKVQGKSISLAIIPHTVKMTNLRSLQPGDPVNLETDITAKYIEKMMRPRLSSSTITLEKLVREGF